MKPLARDMDGGFASIRRLNAELERLENTATNGCEDRGDVSGGRMASQRVKNASG